ncbi:MAG: hypothetical protein JXA52_05185 [Planctomycetes bacterium]|nr:hypothetical protein [Planctomycetota bacterium]
MKLTSDWHIHTPHSCDCGLGLKAGVQMSTLVEQAGRKGISDLGITDHVHTGYNLDDIFRAKKEFDTLPFAPRFHFGVEASCVSQWELAEIESGNQLAKTSGLREGGPPGAPLAIAITEEDLREYGIEYVIGSVHWPMYIPFEREAIIADYHRQNLFLAQHPLVDIVGHPWFWEGHWRDEDGKYRNEPWIDDFGKIPLSLHDEFAAALTENDTAVEINSLTCLFNHRYPDEFTVQYVDYLAYLHERGVKFAIGSDTHGPEYNNGYAAAEPLLESIGLSDDALWRLPAREEVGKTE